AVLSGRLFVQRNRGDTPGADRHREVAHGARDLAVADDPDPRYRTRQIDKMNTQQAKEILSLYRPGTADAEDPSFAEALRLCERDPELERWFSEHCAVYSAL